MEEDAVTNKGDEGATEANGAEEEEDRRAREEQEAEARKREIVRFCIA